MNENIAISIIILLTACSVIVTYSTIYYVDMNNNEYFVDCYADGEYEYISVIGDAGSRGADVYDYILEQGYTCEYYE